ncbi:MAG: hypothetical protein R2911_09435 [Caldilineaceae bacterium]
MVGRAINSGRRIFTFKSFWGVFGWLGLFVDGRIYTALLLFSAALVAALWAIGRTIGRWNALSQIKSANHAALWLDAAGGAGQLCALYNLKFVQHQGRYLFSGAAAH